MRLVRRGIATTIGIALLALGLSTAPTAMASSQPGAGSPSTANALLRLDRSLSLQDAERLAAELSVHLLGVRYENDKLVGEFYFTEPTSSFLSTFQKEFGTQPRVVGLVAAAPVNAKSTDLIREISVPAGYLEFLPNTDFGGSAWRVFEKEAPALTVPEGAAVTNLWAPGFGEYANVNLPNNRALIWQRFVWSGGHRNPNFRDLNFGLEFEVFQHQPGLSGSRPFCYFSGSGTAVSNYRSLFWAQNANFNWTLYYTNGQSASQLGVYADTNEFADHCSNQGMAVGVRYPGLVSSDGINFELAIRIDAPRGSASTNELGAYIQAQESYSCDSWPWNGTAHTDCMGLNTAISPSIGIDLSQSYTMANINTRDLWAPNVCWNTYDHTTVSEFDCSLL